MMLKVEKNTYCSETLSSNPRLPTDIHCMTFDILLSPPGIFARIVYDQYCPC